MGVSLQLACAPHLCLLEDGSKELQIQSFAEEPHQVLDLLKRRTASTLLISLTHFKLLEFAPLCHLLVRSTIDRAFRKPHFHSVRWTPTGAVDDGDNSPEIKRMR